MSEPGMEEVVEGETPNKRHSRKQQLKPLKYRVIFDGCHHERVMSDEELSRPSLKVYDGSSTTKSDYYLCWTCMREEKGTIDDRSTYRKVVAAFQLRG